jgi:mannosyltransferase
MRINSKIGINNKLIILLAILSIGLFLRVYDLSNESLWLDEGFSIKFANLSLSQIFYLQETNPPLYYIILHWWIILFGDSEFSVRFPSVMFGFLSIFMIYKVGNQIFNKDVGILSSLLLGLSVFHIRYSQEARTYSLSVLLTLLSIYFFIKLLRKSSSTVLLGYILYSALLIYSHIYGLFIIIFQNIYIIALYLLSKETNKLSLKRWILIQIILIILFIPWVNIFLAQTLGVVQSGFWIPMPSLSSIKESFVGYSGSKLLFFLYMILSLISIMTYEKISGNISWKNIFLSVESYRWKIGLLNTDKILFLLVWLLTPILLPFIISRFSTPIYHTKYTIVASLAFYLLVAKGINTISQKYLKLIIIIVIIVFSLVYIRGYYTKINKEQWRDVANYIDTNANNGDFLLFSSGIQDIIFNYYSKRTDLIKKGFYAQVDEENIKELAPTVKGYRRVWIILSHSRDEKELITKKLIETYNLSYQNKYKGIKLYLFERKG